VRDLAWTRADVWDALGGHEGPLSRAVRFYRRHLASARRLLDVGCGTGMHTLRLAREGWQVEGCEASAELLERARDHARRSGLPVEFFQWDLRSAVERRPYEAALCMGTAMIGAGSLVSLLQLLQGVARMLVPGGLFIFRTPNFVKLLERPRHYEPVLCGQIRGMESLFLRVYDFTAPPADGVRRGLSELVVLVRQESGWTCQVLSEEWIAWSRADLRSALAASGFADIRWVGDYSDKPFDFVASPDLIGLARKAH
jgi:2-polyprenyl-3-methyl-5-hydroxy-6-metoxy-1,4-benzoquinol methylase